MMQLHTVLFGVGPSIGTDVIKRSRKLGQRAGERLHLLWSWLEWKSYRALHTMIVPYATSFCNINSKKGQGETAILRQQDTPSSAT